MGNVNAHTAITVYGVVAVTFMMAMYALERRHAAFVLAFAAGCLASSAYGFLSGAWPFGVVEAIWSVIAVRRYLQARHVPGPYDPVHAATGAGPHGHGRAGA